MENRFRLGIVRNRTRTRLSCRVLAICGWILVWVLAAAAPPVAAGIAAEVGQVSSARRLVKTDGQQWQIEAWRISYDAKHQIYEADGNVRIWSGNRLLEAQHGRLDIAKRQADLRGEVYVRYGKDWIKGDRVVWNLDTETGWIDGGIVYFAENGFYVRGKKIAKTGPRQFELNEGMVSSCNPEDPDWSITYRKATIDLNGKGQAKHDSFRIKGFPVFYLPYLTFPVNRHRQSGFLMPRFAVSQLNGVEVEVPFYWAMRKDMDFTYFERYLEKRGWMHGGEFRIAHNTLGEGIWLFNYLNDRADEQYLKDNGYPFQQKDRYWFRAVHDFNLAYDIKGYLTLDVVSDKNYLKEFTSGSTSIDYTNHAFNKFADRELINDETVLARENSLYLVRHGEDTVTSLDTRYWDQLDRSLEDATLQQLPRFDFDITPVRLESIPMYYSLETSMVNYWRREGDRGMRLDLHPRLYYPLHIKKYLDIEPSVGVRATGYNVSWDNSDKDSTQGRLLSDVQVELSSRLNRVYRVNFWNITAIQHSFRPELTYLYIPEVDQGDLPEFDDLDRIHKHNAIRYGFSTFITSKEFSTQADGTQQASYREVARLRVSQEYQIEKTPIDDTNQDELDGANNLLTDQDNRFSDVDVKLDITPRRYVTLSYDVSISPYDRTATFQDLTMSLDSRRGHKLNLTYRTYQDTNIDELEGRLKLKILPSVTFDTYHDYSFDKEELFKQSYGITINRGCWNMRLAYKEEGEDKRFMFTIDLLGIGHVGQTFDR